MKNVSFFKKVKLFLLYLKTLNAAKPILLNGDSNMRINKAYQIYTVLHIPLTVKKNGDEVIKTYILQYIDEVDQFFNKLNFIELIGLYEITMKDDENYLIVFGYSGFNTKTLFNKIVLSLSAICFFLYFFIF